MQTILLMSKHVQKSGSNLCSLVLEAPRPRFLVAPYHVRFVLTKLKLHAIGSDRTYLVLEPSVAREEQLEALYESLLSWNLRPVDQPRRTGVLGL